MSDALYHLRIEIRKRVLPASPESQGEDIEDWPAPTPGTWRFSARQLTLNAGEEIRQGIDDVSDFMKLEIKGTRLNIESVDRVMIVATGRIYRITAQPIVQLRTTIISLKSV